MKTLKKKIKINAEIELITGLHIGGNKENVEIGGIDRIVIKLATKKNQPYIPGSSLKGKMRSLLEQVDGATRIGDSTTVNRLFGITEDKRRGITNIPSRIIVRDAMLTSESAKELEECDALEMPYTENKFENSIKRVEGVAENPRQTERVPAGARFAAEFIINIWDDDKEDELLSLFNRGLCLLQNDYIGGSGSRGYGQIKISTKKPITLSNENNWSEQEKVIR